MARGWVLRSRPQGTLSTGIFALEALPDVGLEDGQVRVRNRWISVDPFMRGMLDDHGSYMPTLPLGTMMSGGAVGEVVESRYPALPVGTAVVHNQGWRDEAILAGEACDAIPFGDVPEQHFLGQFGMPGATAYFGLCHAGAAKAGETLFVSSAAGAVGSTVVQIAKAMGLRVIGSAGGPAKCAAVRALGADAMIDYRAGDLSAKLKAAAPDGIDLYFDNVAGDHLLAAIDNARPHMRVILCGMISGYGEQAKLCIPDPMRLVNQRIRLHGYFVPDYYAHWPKFLSDMRRWFLTGALQCPQVIRHGLEDIPAAFLSLFSGDNGVGKVLVELD